MPGIDEFQQNVQVQANPSKKVNNISITDSNVVAAGNSLDIKFFSPAGTVSKIANLMMYVPRPTGAASGTHEIAVYTGGATMVPVFQAKFAFGAFIHFIFGKFMEPPTEMWPVNEQSLIAMMIGQNFDEDDFLTVRYTNNTDVVNDVQRKVSLSLLEEKITG